MLLEVMKYGKDVLRDKAVSVPAVTDEIKQLAQDMLDTMYATNGVGLAAEQVGRTEALCVIDVPRDAEKEPFRTFNESIAMPLVLINPEITALSKETIRASEGCLSFPDIFAHVTRSREVTVSFTDLDGERKTITAQGLLARAIQHEYEHLQGRLFVDNLSQLQKMSIQGKLKRLVAESHESEPNE